MNAEALRDEERPLSSLGIWLDERASALTAAAFSAVAALWIAFASEEPLHIDELRQIAGYSEGPSTWWSASLGLNQPPLEITLGALWRRVFGPTDFAERMLPVLFGLAAVALVGYLAVRFSGVRLAAPVAVLTYGLSPLVFSTTAFIRPYAMPTFASLLFVVTIRTLVGGKGGRRDLLLASLAGVFLLLTHALIPLIVASLTVVALVGRRLFGGSAGRQWWAGLMVASATSAFGLVMPLALRIRNDPYFSSAVEYGWSDRIANAIESLTEAYRGAYGVAGLAILVAGALLLLPPFRPARGEGWWFVPLVAISPGISAVFFATVAPGFQYPDRYLRDVMIVGSLAIALVASRWFQNREPAWRTVALGASGFVVLVLYLWPTLGAFAQEVTTKENTDWAMGSEFIVEHVDPSTQILFEPLRPFPLYQTLYYGRPRYLPARYTVRLPREIVNKGFTLDERPIAVVLFNAGVLKVPPGWQAMQDEGWTLLLPPEEVASDSVAVLQSLDDGISDDRYDVVIRLALTVEAAESGRHQEAVSTLDSVVDPGTDDPRGLFESYWENARQQVLRFRQVGG